MSAMFGAPKLPAVPTPPAAPTMSDPAVQKAAADEQLSRQQAEGRASTFLTNPQTQRKAEKSMQQTLSGLY